MYYYDDKNKKTKQMKSASLIIELLFEIWRKDFISFVQKMKVNILVYIGKQFI